MATQIVYLYDPKAGSGWKVVQKMDQRKMYTIPELDPTDKDVDNLADQRLESSMENDAETLRDTNVIQEPSQIQGVSSIEIPIQSITIDLVAQPISTRRRHRLASTTDTTSTDATGASRSQPEEHTGALSLVEDDKGHRVTNSRINIGYNEWHRATPTAELHSSLAQDIGHVVRTHCPMKWKSWKVMPEMRTEVCGQLSFFKIYIFLLINMNYNSEDLNDELLAYVNRLFAERYKQWKNDLHHHFQAFDDPHVAL
ncbi:unnamed protein product [Prunus brigantina]